MFEGTYIRTCAWLSIQRFARSYLTQARGAWTCCKLRRGSMQWTVQSSASLMREMRLDCGQCPGCIERRQAFAAAGVSEKIERNYKVDLLQETILTPGNADYILRYLDNARSWLRHGDSVRQRLEWHLSGTNIDADQFNSIARRQLRHSKEVIRTLGHLTVQRTKGHVPSVRNTRGTLFEEVMT